MELVLQIRRLRDRHTIRSLYYRSCFESSQFAARATRVSDAYSTDYANFPVFAEVDVSLDELRFNVMGIGIVSIWQTPHFAFLTHPDGMRIYSNYILEFYGQSELADSVHKFSTLEKYLLHNPERASILGRVNSPGAKYIIIADGTHRAALAAHGLVSRINVMVTDR
jgi:hypothetical protein